MNARRLAERQISLPATRDEVVAGDLVVPAGATGIVVFAHGSGSSRHSSRNRAVAATLRDTGLATLLFDLLTPSEERRDEVTAELRFDIPFLAARCRAVLAWAREQNDLAALRVGLFGASTGAAAALVAAAEERGVRAVVSRGGRPDLAGNALARVSAPTLLLVGGHDGTVLELNRAAFDRLAAADKELIVVPGAGHLFEEPGALDAVAHHAATWFERWLAA
ncbi:MAG: dienelactone hydrolase family protein [Chloroflexota bacterium]|nr:dienelactone hydrolase family protein [Chloroflexota bacterium]MDE3194113.1 dienelactone hydrolase family protein [Chloroflexota bacterium]